MNRNQKISNNHFPKNFLQALILILVSFLFMIPAFIMNAIIELPTNILVNLSFIFYCLGIVLIYYQINKSRGNKIHFNFKMGYKKYEYILIIILLNLSLLIPATFLFENLISVENLSNTTQDLSIITLLSIVFIAPFLEELVFRGIILNSFINKYSSFNAIVSSSLLFGLIHFSLIQSIFAFVLGVFIGIVYFKTRSISISFIIHSIANITGLLGIHLNNTYGNKKINSITDIYGDFTVYIIVSCTIMLLVIIYMNRKKNLFSLASN